MKKVSHKTQTTQTQQNKKMENLTLSGKLAEEYERLRLKCDEYYKIGNFRGRTSLYEQLWQIVPLENKFYYNESFYPVRWFVNNIIKYNLDISKEEVLKWIERGKQSLWNYPEKDYIIAQAYYYIGDMENAKLHFKAAWKVSKGREFDKSDKNYQKYKDLALQDD